MQYIYATTKSSCKSYRGATRRLVSMHYNLQGMTHALTWTRAAIDFTTAGMYSTAVCDDESSLYTLYSIYYSIYVSV